MSVVGSGEITLSKSAPKAPDYAGAAQAQADSSREVTEQQTWANRPTINTPFGSQTWNVTPKWDPSTQQYLNTWEQNTTLTPESQQALDSQMALQQGRSDLAAGLLGRVQDEYGEPMDWSQFQQMAQAPQAGQYGQGLPGFGEIPNVPSYDTGGLPARGQQLQGTDYNSIVGNLPSRGQDLQNTDYQSILQGLPNRGQGPGQEQYSPETIQRSLSTEGLQGVDPSQRYYSDAGDALYNQFSSRNEPQFTRDSAALRTQLYNQGLREGDEAYDEEFRKLGQRQDDARQQAAYQATIAAGQEASRMHGMDSATRAQQFGERSSTGAFANQAAQQALNQQLGIGGQRFGQGLQGAQFADQQRASALGEQFGAADRAYSEQQARAGQLDSQRAAALGEQFGAAERGFGEQQAQASQSDEQRAAAMQEMLGIGGQQFQQGLAAGSQQDQQRQQAGQEQLAFGQNRFSEQMQAANYQNTLRQQQIAEEMQRRGFSLNEIQALISGQQVGMPNMPSFSNATRPEALQSLNAAQMTGQANLDAYNAQQQGLQGLLSGGMNAAMMFSDRRLKRNIFKLRTDEKGINWYSYRYFFDDVQKVRIGVMADEVEHIPGVVYTHPSGFKMVNYERLADR